MGYMAASVPYSESVIVVFCGIIDQAFYCKSKTYKNQ